MYRQYCIIFSTWLYYHGGQWHMYAFRTCAVLSFERVIVTCRRIYGSDYIVLLLYIVQWIQLDIPVPVGALEGHFRTLLESH